MPRPSTPAPDTQQPSATVAPSGQTGETPGREAADARVAAADNPAERAGAAASHPDAPEPSGRSLAPGLLDDREQLALDIDVAEEGPGKA